MIKMVMMNYDEFRKKDGDLDNKKNKLNKHLKQVKIDKLKNKKEKLVKKKQEVDKELFNKKKSL